MNQCLWFWDGIEWVEDPEFPHDCPFGQHCPVPAGPGPFIGAAAFTACAPFADAPPAP